MIMLCIVTAFCFYCVIAMLLSFSKHSSSTTMASGHLYIMYESWLHCKLVCHHMVMIFINFITSILIIDILIIDILIVDILIVDILIVDILIVDIILKIIIVDITMHSYSCHSSVDRCSIRTRLASSPS